MEVSLESIIGIISLLFGGGGLGIFFTWKYAKKRAEAEAHKAMAEAEKAKAEAIQAEIEAKKADQDYYQQLAKDLAEDREDRKRQNDELRAERDHYKTERNEYRDQIDKVTRSVAEYKLQTDEKIQNLQRQVARNGRQIEAMRPFMCADMKCKKRQLVTISDEGIAELERTVRKQNEKKPADIEPIEHQDL